MSSRWMTLALLGAIACGAADGADPEAPERKSLADSGAVETGGPNRAPRVSSVSLSSRTVVAGVPIEVNFEGDDPDGNALTFQVTWLHNGRTVQAGKERTWLPGRVEKGDRIEARVTAHDGELESEPVVAASRVGNSAPEIARILLEPQEAPKRGETLSATPVASDADGDELEISYEWFVNGDRVRSADGAKFELSEVRRGDRVRARVRVRDTSDEVTADTPEVVVANAPPAFEKFAGFELADGVFRHQFRAVDPDGDKSLRFVLAEGPRGMEVDSTLGIATWRPDESASGTIPVQVEVQDAFGAASALRFELTLDRAASSAPPAQAQAAE
jgi:hypothetical protein